MAAPSTNASMPHSMTMTNSSGMSGMSGMAGMDGMDGMDSSTMMSNVFFQSSDTPLFLSVLKPATVGAYASACFFLLCLAVLLRLLLAGRAWAEARWLDAEMKRRYVVVGNKPDSSANSIREKAMGGVTTEINENGESVRVMPRKGTPTHTPWRLSIDPLRAFIDTIIAAMSYLLMIAAMTMNVGYFFAILAGVFVGSLLLGRFTAHSH